MSPSSLQRRPTLLPLPTFNLPFVHLHAPALAFVLLREHVLVLPASQVLLVRLALKDSSVQRASLVLRNARLVIRAFRDPVVAWFLKLKTRRARVTVLMDCVGVTDNVLAIRAGSTLPMGRRVLNVRQVSF